MDRVQLVPLSHEDEEGAVTTVDDVVKILREFDVTSAHCYNPNEESRLMTVIQAVGVDKFNESIRDVAKIYANRKSKRVTGKGSSTDRSILSSTWALRSNTGSSIRMGSRVGSISGRGRKASTGSNATQDDIVESAGKGRKTMLASISSRSIGRLGSNSERNEPDSPTSPDSPGSKKPISPTGTGKLFVP